MFSLQIGILLALSTAAIGDYSIVRPYAFKHPFPESYPDMETTTTPKTITTPVPETTTVPPEEEPIPETTLPPPPPKKNFTIPEKPHRKGSTACICKECTTDDGCVIKHYRQYNYYYPNGQKVTLPMNKPEPVVPQELTPQSIPLTSTIHVSNNNGKSTVSYNLPGVVSYIPNNGHNFVYNQAAFALNRNPPVLYNAPHLHPKPIIMNDEPPGPSDSPASEDNNDSSAIDEPTTPSVVGDTFHKGVVTYLSDPNVFGHTRMTIIKNANVPNFQSQQISVSSMPLRPSLPLPGYQPTIDWLGGASASPQIYQPNIQYINPVRSWYNIPTPPPLSPYYTLPNIPADYSVVL